MTNPAHQSRGNGGDGPAAARDIDAPAPAPAQEQSPAPAPRPRTATERDLAGIVACHMAAFPGQLMRELGPTWLAGLYRHYLRHPQGLSLVTEQSGRVLGFCVGGHPHIRAEFVKTAPLRYAHVILGRVFVSPVVRQRALGTFATLFQKKQNHPDAQAAAHAEAARRGVRLGTLLSIGVLPAARGSDVAGCLIEAFADACAARGYGYLELGVYTSNTRAIAFYQRHGWEKIGECGTSSQFGLNLAARNSLHSGPA
jgi:ribosomal protein S18 acetylase RimI-like enzyme